MIYKTLVVVLMVTGITPGNSNAVPDWCECHIFGDPEIHLFDGELLVSMIDQDGILTKVGGHLCPFKFSYTIEQSIDGGTKVTGIRIERPHYLLELSEGNAYINGELITGFFHSGQPGGFDVHIFGPFTVGYFVGCEARFAWSWIDGSAFIGMSGTLASNINGGGCGNCNGVQDDLPDE